MADLRVVTGGPAPRRTNTANIRTMEALGADVRIVTRPDPDTGDLLVATSTTGTLRGCVDALRARGHRPTFADIGGGIPMAYLDDRGAWETFWSAHRAGLTGDGPPQTFGGHGLGLAVDDDAGRRLRFPHGVAVGDLEVFPNTAGYLMHILESASHQIPLARNVVVGRDGVRSDLIDLAP